jgi:hypothetical protein
MLDPIAFTAEINPTPVLCKCLIGGTGSGPPCSCSTGGLGVGQACPYPQPR